MNKEQIEEGPSSLAEERSSQEIYKKHTATEKDWEEKDTLVKVSEIVPEEAALLEISQDDSDYSDYNKPTSTDTTGLVPGLDMLCSLKSIRDVCLVGLNIESMCLEKKSSGSQNSRIFQARPLIYCASTTTDFADFTTDFTRSGTFSRNIPIEVSECC